MKRYIKSNIYNDDDYMYDESVEYIEMNSNSVKEMFPDWADMQPGSWSKNGKILRYGKDDNDFVEIGLYREPMNNEEYAGRYTLQIFDGDDVIFCKSVE